MAFEKLITALQAFNKPQHQRFLLYLQSPYFNTPEAALQLYGYLARLHPLYPAGKLKTTAIAKKIPALHNKNKQAKAGTELLKMILQFIAQEEWQKNHHEQTVAQLQGLKNLHLFDWYKQIAEKTGLLQSEITHADIDTLYYRHRLTEINLNGFDARLQRQPSNDINKVIFTLDEFHALKKIRYLCEAISRNQWFGSGLCDADITALVNKLSPYYTNEHPYVFAVINLLHMLLSPTFDQAMNYYSPLKEYTASCIHKQQFSRLLIEINQYAINFCLRWNNLGYTAAGKEYMWWIEWQIKQDLLLENNKIQPIVFRNIIGIAAKNHYPANWLLRFIEHYSPFLPETMRANNVAYVLGIYFYTLGDYSEAVHQFTAAETKTEPIFNCILKRWIFICRYQSSNNTDHLDSLLFTYEKYIERHRADLHHFTSVFLKFIFYAKKRLTTHTKSEKNALAEALEQQEFFPGKDWLLTTLQ